MSETRKIFKKKGQIKCTQIPVKCVSQATGVKGNTKRSLKQKITLS